MNNSHQILNEKAKRIAKGILLSEGELLLVLTQMKKAGSFLALGFPGIFEYCTQELRFSNAQAYYYKSVIQASVIVPELTASVVQGELTLSQARRIVPVITLEPAKKSEWIEKARTLPQLELEQAVTLANPDAKPREKLKPVTPELFKLETSVTNATQEDLKSLTHILSAKLHRPAKLSDVIAWMAQEMRQKHDPVKKAERSISSGNAKPPKVGRQVIPAGVRHDVIRRSENKCEFEVNGKRCGQPRWTQFHHQIEVANGGLNTLENLQLLCSAHHRYWHAQTHSPGAKPRGAPRLAGLAKEN